MADPSTTEVPITNSTNSTCDNEDPQADDWLDGKK